jgi:hypothetical protein
MDRTQVYYGFTTYGQRLFMMREYERTGNISEHAETPKCAGIPSTVDKVIATDILDNI